MAEPITEKEKIENPNAGGMSTRALVVVFVLYALSRSIKPSSSYLPHYFPYADALSSEVPNYTKLGPLYHTKIQPVATVSQFLFYIAVVLFSSQIGFDVIIWLDIFCQIANVLITCLIRIPTCRNLMVAQLGTFVYGISTATGNVFHNFAYCVFEKDMYHKISGYTRSATLFGHLLGSSLGGVIYEYGFDKISKFTGLIENKVSGASDIAKLDYSAIFKESNMKVKEFLMNGIVLLLFLTAGCMLFTFIVAFFFPKLSKEAKKASKKSVSKTLKDIAKASSEFKKKEVLFWAIAWSFSLMAMLYSKQWCPNLWKHYQDFYKEKPRNGIFDAVAYVCGAVGALVPGMINKRIGFGASITLQLFVTAIAVVLAFLQTIHLGNIYFYYGIHALFTFIIYYSMAFQSGELARSTSSDKIKLLFYMMNAGTFFIQVVLNQFLDGFGRVPSIDITSRYYIMTGFMLFNFMVVFIGFSGAHRHSPTKVLEESGTSATPVSTSSNKEEK